MNDLADWRCKIGLHWWVIYYSNWRGDTASSGHYGCNVCKEERDFRFLKTMGLRWRVLGWLAGVRRKGNHPELRPAYRR